MTCPNCGADVGSDSAACPTCLLKLGLAGEGEEETALSPERPGRRTSDLGLRLTPGQQFGPYRVERLLGRGGMGEVYEAEHMTHRRRVAIKVLRQALADQVDRARFLREGQLAASVSHPNTVYIFGAEEIDGTPVIVMELVAAGTLKDRVTRQGPMPPAAAVDAVLQIIRGLDAAQAAGILHRDIKPSNCFVDRDGTVKIGDFGLSISTMARGVTEATTEGTFRGTPQFASPEQLKGDPLDARADIYAVGATLYYLLTGAPPFDAEDIMALVARVTTDEPVSPRTLAPRVPRGLAQVVLRCLAKDPAARPDSYAALARELRPFGSAAPTPATMGLRVAAAMVDYLILAVPVAMLEVWLLQSAEASMQFQVGLVGVVTLAVAACYFGVSEGAWGRSPGKRLLGLRVVGTAGQPVGYARAFARVALYQVPFYVQTAPYLVFGYGPLILWANRTGWSGLALNAYLLLLAALFSTSRRRNGFAGLHDLATGTRVVRRHQPERPETWSVANAPEAATEVATAAYGPYDVTGLISATDAGELLAGFDPALRRKIWIHVVPTDAPPLTSRRRAINRTGRLRWLAGHQGIGEAWDAFEALDGVALADPLIARCPQPWSRVSGWLADLAAEIDAGIADDTLPVLSLDRIWLTRDGHARLLDFRAPGATRSPDVPAPVTTASAQAFLATVTRSALSDADTSTPVPPPPASALQAIASLERAEFHTLSSAVAAFAAWRGQSDRVTRLRRAASLGPFWLPPALTTVGAALLLFVLTQVSPEALRLGIALSRLDSKIQASAGRPASEPSNERLDRERQALEMYIAGRFTPMIADERTWANPMTASILLPHRQLALDAIARHPDVTGADLAAVRADHAALIRAIEQPQGVMQFSASQLVGASLVIMTALGVVYALAGLLTAMVFKVGLTFRLAQTTIVTREGTAVSRRQALYRTLAAWSPLLLMLLPFPGDALGNGALVGAVFAIGIAWALASPERGLQDRVAGTWLVPS